MFCIDGRREFAEIERKRESEREKERGEREKKKEWMKGGKERPSFIKEHRISQILPAFAQEDCFRVVLVQSLVRKNWQA